MIGAQQSGRKMLTQSLAKSAELTINRSRSFASSLHWCTIASTFMHLVTYLLSTSDISVSLGAGLSAGAVGVLVIDGAPIFGFRANFAEIAAHQNRTQGVPEETGRKIPVKESCRQQLD
jgi:hypothetical protein